MYINIDSLENLKTKNGGEIQIDEKITNGENLPKENFSIVENNIKENFIFQNAENLEKISEVIKFLSEEKEKFKSKFIELD